MVLVVLTKLMLVVRFGVAKSQCLMGSGAAAGRLVVNPAR